MGTNRRYSRRRAVRLPARLRLLGGGLEVGELALSGLRNAEIRDLGAHGLGLETRDLIPAEVTPGRARLFLEWTLPGGTRINAAADPVWSAARPGRALVVGLRIVEISGEHQSALRGFVQAPAVDRAPEV